MSWSFCYWGIRLARVEKDIVCAAFAMILILDPRVNFWHKFFFLFLPFGIIPISGGLSLFLINIVSYFVQACYKFPLFLFATRPFTAVSKWRLVILCPPSLIVSLRPSRFSVIIFFKENTEKYGKWGQDRAFTNSPWCEEPISNVSLDERCTLTLALTFICWMVLSYSLPLLYFGIVDHGALCHAPILHGMLLEIRWRNDVYDIGVTVFLAQNL